MSFWPKQFSEGEQQKSQRTFEAMLNILSFEIPSHSGRMATIKKTNNNAGKDVRKMEPLYTVREYSAVTGTMETSKYGPPETKSRTTIRSIYTSPK